MPLLSHMLHVWNIYQHLPQKNTQMQVNISYIEHMGLLGPETVAVRFSVTGECHAKATAWSLSLRAEAASLAEVFSQTPSSFKVIHSGE